MALFKFMKRIILLIFGIIVVCLSTLFIVMLVVPPADFYLSTAGADDLAFMREAIMSCMGEPYLARPKPPFSEDTISLCGYLLTNYEVYTFHSELRWARIVLVFSCDIPYAFSHMDSRFIDIFIQSCQDPFKSLLASFRRQLLKMLNGE